MPWKFFTGTDPLSGQATGHLDCLKKVVTFLTNTNVQPTLGVETDIATEGMGAEAWTDTNRNTTSGFTVDGEVWLQGPGKAAADEIHVGIETASKAPRFDWRLQGATGFNSGSSFDNQPGAIPIDPLKAFGTPFILLDNDIFDFYIIANGNRFMVIAFITNTVQFMYGGFIEAYGPPTPNRYPYPLMIVANQSDPTVAISDTSTLHSWGFSTKNIPPGSANKTGFLLAEQFAQWFTNIDLDASNISATQAFFFVLPPQSVLPGPDPDDEPRPIGLTENNSPLPGDRILYRCEVMVNANQQLSRIGFVDGVFWGSGLDGPLNTRVDVGGIDHVGAHNTFRNQWHEYLFFKLT